MECKYANLRHIVRTDTELIDTLWNVNDKTLPCLPESAGAN